MSFLINLGYKFSLPSGVNPDGGIMLGSKIAKHTLERRKIGKIPFMANRYFDPQLYMSSINAYECSEDCVKLSSYPWFGTKNVQEYESKELNQKQWKENAQKTILDSWLGETPSEPSLVREMVKECIDFQITLGCSGIIFPSPLTFDFSTDYALELMWLDCGLEYIKSAEIKLPVFPTVALADSWLRLQDPSSNQLIQLILDSISAREVQGVYFLIEQGNEKQDTRYMANSRALESALYITHVFANVCRLRVITNFFGPFGLVLEAAGAEAWASDWYKSLVRFRLGDVPKPATARAWPSFWSYPLIADISLESEFEALMYSGFMNRIKDVTPASDNLFRGVSNRVPVNQIVDWRFAQSNVAAAIEHYELSAIQAEKLHNNYTDTKRLDFVEKWLINAADLATQIKGVLPKPLRTKLDHVFAWRDAFLNYRRSQSV